MASPYFQNINLQKQDFSALQAGGRAMGEAYASAFNAIGQIGSAYFERKSMERKAQEIVKTPQGQRMLVANGMSEDEVAEMSQDPKKANKMMYDIINDAGGIEQFNKKMTEFQNQERLIESHKQQKEINAQTIRKNNYLIAQARNQQKEIEIRNDYMNHVTQRLREGNTDDVTDGFSINDGVTASIVDDVNKKLGYGRYNPKIVSESAKYFHKTDNDGTVLNQNNFFSVGELNAQLDEFLNTDFGRNLPQEQRVALRKRLEGTIDGAGGKDTVADLFQKGIKESGFGEFAEAMSNQIGTMGRFSAMLETAMAEVDKDEEGNPIFDVINPTAGSVALIQLARLAQGAGVLSNQDVDRISGSERFEDSWSRWIDSKIGDKRTLTQEMYDKSPYYKNSINPRTGERFKVGEEFIVGGSSPSATDLQMFRDIARTLDRRSNEFAKKIIPDIYKKVRAKYGGFTIDELNTQTDLHKYMPQGLVDLSPSAEVRDSDLSNAIAMRMQGMSLSDIAFIVETETKKRGEWDEDTSRPALKFLLNEVKKSVPDEFVDEPPSQSPFDPPMPSRFNEPTKPTNPPNPLDQRKVKERKEDLENQIINEIIANRGNESFYNDSSSTSSVAMPPPVLDNIDGKDTVAGLFGASAGFVVSKNILKKFADKNTLRQRGISPKNFQANLKNIDKATPSQLKTTAKFHKVDPDSKNLKQALKKKLTQEVSKLTKERLARRGIGKKILQKAMSTAFTIGGAGIGGSLFFAQDLIEISQAQGKIKREELINLKSKYDEGTEIRKLIDEMLMDINYESSDFKQFQSRYTKGKLRSDGVYDKGIYVGSGNRAYDYELYRAIQEGI